MIECDIFSIDENLKLIVTTYSYLKYFENGVALLPHYFSNNLIIISSEKRDD